MALLIGRNNIGATGFGSASQMILVPIVATFSGIITELAVHSLGAANLKLAIYADASGPSTRLWVKNTNTLVAAGWNTIAVSNIPVIAGVTYWLAYNGDTGTIVTYDSSTGGAHYLAADYATVGCPADPSGSTHYGSWPNVQAWGTPSVGGGGSITIF
jgi:hypothetical protein